MFGFWCERGRNFAATARHFNRAITTVRKIANLQTWTTRAEEIDGKIRDHTDRKIVKNEISNIRLVRTLKKKLAKELFAQKILDATVKDFIALLRYEDELLENLPNEGESLAPSYNFNFGDLSDADKSQIRRNVAAAWATPSANRL